MKGVGIKGDGVLDRVGTYEVSIEGGGSITVNDNELGNVSNYEMLEDQAMIDYTQAYATLSSFLMVYMNARDDVALAMRDYLNSRYVKRKSMPFKNEARDLGGFSASSLQSMMTDSHIKALTECEKEYIVLRNNHSHYSKICQRLERSLMILERAWDTARSLNANNRKSLGG